MQTDRESFSRWVDERQSDRRLRDLLQDRVADTVAVDLASSAWDRAQRTRRRRAGALAGAVAVAGVVAVAAGCDDSSGPPTATARAERAGTYGGAPVWWVPTTATEEGLPVLRSAALPVTIDLAPGAPEMPARDAVALVEVTGDKGAGRVVVVANDGSYSLDTAHLEPVTDEQGDQLTRVGPHSLEPDGRHAFFRQNSSLELYDFALGSWTTVPAPDRTAEAARWLRNGLLFVPDSLDPMSGGTVFRADGEVVGSSEAPHSAIEPSKDEPYGPLRAFRTSSAQAHHLAGPVADPDGSDHLSLDGVVADAGGRRGVLVVPAEGGGGRFDACCPVAGWLDLDTVVFESRWVHARLLAWRVGTDELFRVSDVVGWSPGRGSYVASFADLSSP